MEKNTLKELVIELIAQNQKQLDFAKGDGIQRQIDYYQGKIDAYKIIQETF